MPTWSFFTSLNFKFLPFLFFSNLNSKPPCFHLPSQLDHANSEGTGKVTGMLCPSPDPWTRDVSWMNASRCLRLSLVSATSAPVRPHALWFTLLPPILSLSPKGIFWPLEENPPSWASGISLLATCSPSSPAWWGTRSCSQDSFPLSPLSSL